MVSNQVQGILGSLGIGGAAPNAGRASMQGMGGPGANQQYFGANAPATPQQAVWAPGSATENSAYMGTNQSFQPQANTGFSVSPQAQVPALPTSFAAPDNRMDYSAGASGSGAQ
ncbi:hypothetical protein FRC08_008285 [Ceratobasidium sp. 394]|nr:hypothetical protein FRC08_008285 [Ceratobasidium sp. 394]